MIWEYTNAHYDDDVKLIPILSEFGRAGWEVCGIVHRETWSRKTYEVFFKRPIPEPSHKDGA